MKHCLLSCLLLLICLSGISQPLSVKQLDTKWKKLFCQGCEAYDNQELDKAEDLLELSLKLLKDNGADISNSEIYSIMKLAEVYHEENKTEDLKTLTQEMVAIKGKIRPRSNRYLNYLYCLSVYYSNTGQYEKAIAVADEALSSMDALPELQVWKNKIVHRKALCYYCLGKTEDAIVTEKLCVGDSASLKPEYLQSLVYYLYKSGKYNEMGTLLSKCFYASREPILRKFNFSDAGERASFWSKAGLFFTNFLPMYANSVSSEVTAAICYDGALFAKGLLLAATNRTNDMILGSGNKKLLDAYSRYLTLKRKKDRNVDEDFEIKALSNVFIKYQQEHKEFYRNNFRISWTDVMQALPENSIAIEFVRTIGEDGVYQYGALSIKHGYKAPHYTKLCNENQVIEIPKDNIYTKSDLYDLVWKPLEMEINGVDCIYFSPSGFMYKTGVEYLPDDDGLNICNMYSIYRLSSTKELVLQRRMQRTKTAALFGGINYDTSISTLSSQKNSNIGNDKISDIPSTYSFRSVNKGRKINFLQGTLDEVSNIDNLLLKAGYATKLYTGDNGSETYFKNLNDEPCDILHIATHGFYYSGNISKDNKNLDSIYRDTNLRFVNDDVEIIDEDKMLTRSGLVFAGADNAINGASIPVSIDDGILYADEISTINLSNIDIAILSACQSGLGDIDDSEGVFGLQRGFKLAGVNTIIMSLWKVDDQATRIFMVELYKNIVKGYSVRKAMNEAQIVLRSVDDGKYDDPLYWAAFVLLDGLQR